MAFLRGNRAIRDHLKDGKELRLFEYVDRGIVRYIDIMIYSGHEIVKRPDTDVNIRDAIIFHLTPEDNIIQTVFDSGEFADSQTLNELRQSAIQDQDQSRTSRESVNRVYFRSDAIKRYALKRSSGICEACGSKTPFITKSGRPYLEVHHIHHLSDGGPDHPNWVAGVCPNCHRRSHFGEDRDEFNKQLRNIILEKERSFGF